MTSISDRLAAATGPDDALDGGVLVALGWTIRPGNGPQPLPDWLNPGGLYVGNPPHVTGSIDAAIAVIEARLPGCRHAVGKGWSGVCFASVGPSRDIRPANDAVCEAPTQPLALLRALFKAMAFMNVDVK